MTVPGRVLESFWTATLCLLSVAFSATAVHAGEPARPELAVAPLLPVAVADRPRHAEVDLQAAGWASSCVTCHGAAQPVKDSIIPSLVGMSAQSIQDTMSAYAATDEDGELMHQIAKGYDTETIRRIAVWYASLPVDQ